MIEEIKGEKIVLRKFKPEFAPLLFEAAHESRGGEFTRWMPWCHENYSLEESESFIATKDIEWQNGSIYGFAIFDAETKKFVGGIGLNQPNDFHKFYNLGYWVRVSQQNRGIISEAARLLAKEALAVLPINRIEIVCAIENIASQKAAEKAGATREGVLRKRLAVGKRIHDGVMFAFVAEDFSS